MINFLQPKSKKLRKYRILSYLAVIIMGIGIYFVSAPLMPVLSYKTSNNNISILPANLDPGKKQLDKIYEEDIAHLPDNLIVDDRINIKDSNKIKNNIKVINKNKISIKSNRNTSKKNKTKILGVSYNKQAIEQLKRPIPKENRIIIPKMGVSDVILEGKSANTLWKGIWRMPVGSTPDNGGNTIITAHRYLHKPPSTKTFFLIDKLKPGDMITVYWQGKEYKYKVRLSKIVKPSETSILFNTPNSQLTLFSCTPLYTSKNRLVVIADLI